MDGDTNVVDEWLRKQPDAVRAKFATDFNYLAVVPKAQWSMPKTTMLQGEFSELREFRVHSGRVQYRLAGFHRPGNEVVLCSGWTHNQSPAKRKAAMNRALKLKQRVEQGEVITVEHVI